MERESPGAFATTGYDSPRRRIRWFPLKNMTNETIPGFALVMLKHSDRDYFFTQDVSDQQVVWRGYKPDETAEALQNPAMLAINGPTPIPPGQIGKCTQDWPAQVLHDGSKDTLPNAIPCGPKAGSWYVWSDAGAFTCLSHDATRAAPGTENSVHTVWVAPNTSFVTPFAAMQGGQTVQARTDIVFSSAAPNAVSAQPPDSYYDNNQLKGYEIDKKSQWWVAVSATVSSQTAPEGTPLRLRVYDSGSATYLTGHRIQTIDTKGSGKPGQDYYGGDPIYTAENVAFSGPLIVDAGHHLTLRNDSSYSIIVADVIFALFRLAAQIDKQGSLSYT